MSTLTSRLQMVKPAIIDSMKNWDAENGQVWEKLDAWHGAREVVTIPSPSFIGELVRETSTNTYRRWNGSFWTYVGRPDHYAGSYETSAEETSTFSFTGGTNAIIYGAPFTVRQNHWYRIVFCAQVEWDSDATVGNIALQIRTRVSPLGDTVLNTSNILREFTYNVDSQSTIATPCSGSAIFHHGAAESMLSVGIFGVGDNGFDWHVNGGPGAGGSLKPSTQILIHDIGND